MTTHASAAPAMTGRRPPIWRRWGSRAVLTVVLLAGLGIAGWVVHRWANYPSAPDVAAVDLESAINFMATEEFNRLLERHRLRYAMAVVDRLGQSSFSELAMIMMRWDERRVKIAQNLRDIEGHDRLGSRVFAIFLEKFYDQSPAQRQAALVMIAMAQQGQIASRPQAFALPSIDEFKQDMGRFLTRQPPRVQAMCGQFLIDLKNQRTAMGLKDPF